MFADRHNWCFGFDTTSVLRDQLSQFRQLLSQHLAPLIAALGIRASLRECYERVVGPPAWNCGEGAAFLLVESTEVAYMVNPFKPCNAILRCEPRRKFCTAGLRGNSLAEISHPKRRRHFAVATVAGSQSNRRALQRGTVIVLLLS